MDELRTFKATGSKEDRDLVLRAIGAALARAGVLKANFLKLPLWALALVAADFLSGCTPWEIERGFAFEKKFHIFHRGRKTGREK
jgi:hypothetical protein